MKALQAILLFSFVTIAVLIAVWKLYSNDLQLLVIKQAQMDPPEEQLPPDVFRDFLHHHCDVVRIGGLEVNAGSLNRLDAAWWACKDMYEDMKQSKDCLVYGLGSGNDVSFDVQLAEVGCEVHSFDIVVTPENLFENSKNIFAEVTMIQNFRSWKHTKWNWHYHLIGLGESDNIKENILSLPTIVNSLKHQSRIFHYFKIDIEGPEYVLLKDIEAMAERIKTFSGEWHPHSIPQIEMNRNAYNTLRKMEAKGFRMFRRDIRYDFIVPDQLAAMDDSNQINALVYFPMSIMGELYFVNTKFVRP